MNHAILSQPQATDGLGFSHATGASVCSSVIPREVMAVGLDQSWFAYDIDLIRFHDQASLAAGAALVAFVTEHQGNSTTPRHGRFVVSMSRRFSCASTILALPCQRCSFGASARLET